MKSRTIYVAMVTAVLMSAVDGLNPTTTKKTTTTTKPTTTRYTTKWTTAPPGGNLNGKMFTLSSSGGIYFFPPHFSLASLSRSAHVIKKFEGESLRAEKHLNTTPPHTPRTTTTTRRPRTTTTTRRPRTTTYPTTTRPPVAGVSVCLRYATSFQLYGTQSIFTFSPSSKSLMLRASSSRMYTLIMNSYYTLNLVPDRYLWTVTDPSIWTSVCLTVDTVKGVAQVFEDSTVSVREILPIQYVWTGDPLIDISGFTGQVTDIQIWDYPVHYKEILYYMTIGPYRSYGGNVLSWSNISFKLRGSVLLEDSYEQQARQPISTLRRAKKKFYKALKAERKL